MSEFAFGIRARALIPLELAANLQLQPARVLAVQEVIHIHVDDSGHLLCCFCVILANPTKVDLITICKQLAGNPLCGKGVSPTILISKINESKIHCHSKSAFPYFPLHFLGKLPLDTRALSTSNVGTDPDSMADQD